MLIGGLARFLFLALKTYRPIVASWTFHIRHLTNCHEKEVDFLRSRQVGVITRSGARRLVERRGEYGAT